MNTNRIYQIANEILDSYHVEGVKNEDLLSYLNKSQDNFNYVYNKTLMKCNMDQLEVKESEVKTILKDIIRDRIAFLNDSTRIGKA